jgi:hypothetical protein
MHLLRVLRVSPVQKEDKSLESPLRSCQHDETQEGAPFQLLLPPSTMLVLSPLGAPRLPPPNWGEATARVAAASEDAAMEYFMVLMCWGEFGVLGLSVWLRWRFVLIEKLMQDNEKPRRDDGRNLPDIQNGKARG